MARFYRLKVKEIRRETPEAVSVLLEIPPPLQPQYLFRQGQYLTFKVHINGEEVRRSYSLCSAPHERILRVAVKEVPGGKMSSYINHQLKEGDEIDVMTPMGKFYTPLSGSNSKFYVLMAGGSGITPMMSIIKSILFVEKQSRIVLIYANRHPDSVIFKKELEELQQKNPQALQIYFMYEAPPENHNPVFSGIMTEKACETLMDKLGLHKADEFFICGPTPMMENIHRVLGSKGIPQDKIHIEYFTAVSRELAENSEESSESDVESEVTVILYGVETTFRLKGSGINILEAAIEAGVDAPFSCKGAVCCTCRAKVLEGKVKMDANYALTDSEVEQGYVLTCQSHPVSERVIIDYDAP